MKTETIVDALVGYAGRTKFEDLPPVVVHECKRILLDSVGCALAALNSDKGKIAIDMARQMNGPAEATIIGSGDRVSCFASAFANGELINALDYDPVAPPGHVTPFVLPPSLSLAESMNASGKQVIRAIALAHEISVRLAKALRYARDIVNGKVSTPQVHGYSSTIFGGTAAAGSILGLDDISMANALGISGYLAPVQAIAQWVRSVPLAMTKYLMAGWMCEAALTSVFLAQRGYSGDTAVLDGDSGFWRFSGSSKWEPAEVIDKLGENWVFPQEMVYKPYPCCRVLHAGLDCLIGIIDENRISPDEIEKITAYIEPFCVEPAWQNNEIVTQADAQFSVAYNFAVAAHRIPSGIQWQDLDTMRSPKILEFMKKVRSLPHPEYESILKVEPTARPARVEVEARGRIFTEEQKYAKGTQTTEDTIMSDRELVEKFRYNAHPVLPTSRIDKAIELLFGLESVADFSNVMTQLIP